VYKDTKDAKENKDNIIKIPKINPQNIAEIMQFNSQNEFLKENQLQNTTRDNNAYIMNQNADKNSKNHPNPSSADADPENVLLLDSNATPLELSGQISQNHSVTNCLKSFRFLKSNSAVPVKDKEHYHHSNSINNIPSN